MFDLNCDFVMLGLTNLWSVFSVEWFLVERNPLLDTSKQFTWQLRCVISVHYGEVEKVAESGQLWELISQQFFAENT